MMNLPEYVDEDEVKTMFGCADKVSRFKSGFLKKIFFENDSVFNHAL